MSNKTTGARGAILACALFFAFRLTARLLSVAYSMAATDILYMDGWLPSVLTMLRQAFLAAAAGTVIAGLNALDREVPKLISLGMAWGVCLSIFADAASAFLIDVCSGAVQDFAVWMALIVNILTVLVEAAFVWIVYAISRRNKPTQTPARSVLLAVCVHLLGYLAMETAYLIQFLGEVGFSLSVSVGVEILGTYLGIILWQGGVVWLVAVLLMRLFRRKKQAHR